MQLLFCKGCDVIESTQHINHELLAIHDWCYVKRMSLNLTKTKFILDNRKIPDVLKIDDNFIERTKS